MLSIFNIRYSIFNEGLPKKNAKNSWCGAFLAVLAVKNNFTGNVMQPFGVRRND